MILVHSSVWMDFFRGTTTPQSERLDVLLGSEPLAVGNLILAEVLQGFSSEKDFNKARKLLTELDVIELGGEDVAIQAARNYRALRVLGVTIRKTIDSIIATRCIEGDYALLYSDRDFDPFVEHPGLRSALRGAVSHAMSIWRPVVRRGYRVPSGGRLIVQLNRSKTCHTSMVS